MRNNTTRLALTIRPFNIMWLASLLVTACGAEIEVAENKKATFDPTIEGGSILATHYSAGGELFYVGIDQNIKIYPTDSWIVRETVFAEEGGVRSISPHPDNLDIAVAHGTSWYVYNSTTQEKGPETRLPQAVCVKVAFSNSGKFLAVAGLKDTTGDGADDMTSIYIYETGEEYKEVKEIETNGLTARILIYSPDDKLLYYGGENVKLMALEVENDYQVSAEIGSSSPDDLSISPDGSKLAIVNKDLEVYDRKSSKLLKKIISNPDPQFSSVAFTIDNKYLLVGGRKATNRDGLLKVYRTEDWSQLYEFQTHRQAVNYLEVNPKDKTSFVTASGVRDNQVKVWKITYVE